MQALSHEDVHIATLDNAGANFGWPYFEGTAPPFNPIDPFGEFAPTHSFDPTIHDEPIFSYPHAGISSSIIGGEVYRGSQFPDEWDGVYFYGDFTLGRIEFLTINPLGQVDGTFPFKPTEEIPEDATQLAFIGVGVDGALYYVSLGGSVHRFTHTGNRAPEVLSVAADPAIGPPPLQVDFVGQVTDVENDSLTFTWHFGDGAVESGSVVDGIASAVHAFESDGQYEAFLEVSDGQQTVFTDFVTVIVGERDLRHR